MNLWTVAELNRPLRNANAVYDRYTNGPRTLELYQIIGWWQVELPPEVR